MKVLFVEDEKLVARMYEKISEQSGFETKIATNGLEAISTAKEWQPDLIFMDIMMPEMNGISALKQLKIDDTTKAIPVVMLTNLSGTHDEELAISEGAATFWVKKDIDFKNFKDQVLEILAKNVSN